MKIFISVLTLTSQIDVACCASLLSNCRDLDQRGHETTLYFETANCYLSLCRSRAAAAFLDSDCDVFIFVDSDLWFPYDAMWNLIKHDKPFVSGVYPYRDGHQGYPITTKGEWEGDLLLADWCTVGFSATKREVLETLVKKHPEWVTNYQTKKGSKVHAIYDIGLHYDDENYWTEDFLFCKRIREHGYKVYVETRIPFEHAGRMAIKGMLADYLARIKK